MHRETDETAVSKKRPQRSVQEEITYTLTDKGMSIVKRIKAGNKEVPAAGHDRKVNLDHHIAGRAMVALI